jgi:hypothetical protein
LWAEAEDAVHIVVFLVLSIKGLCDISLNKLDSLSPLIFNFALEYAIRKAQEDKVGLKLNGTHQLLIYADDVNHLEDNIDTIKKKKETLIEDSKKFDLPRSERRET